MTFYKGRPGAGAGSAGRVHAALEDQVQFLVLIQVSYYCLQFQEI